MKWDFTRWLSQLSPLVQLMRSIYTSLQFLSAVDRT